MERKVINKALKYAMNFYSIQEHELRHELVFFKKLLKEVKKKIVSKGKKTDIYLISSNLNNTEKKLVLLAERYIQEKAGEKSCFL